MNSLIREKCEEINLMLVMTSETDKESIRIISELYQDIKKQAEEAGLKEIYDACIWLESQSGSDNYYDTLVEFTKSLGHHLDDPSRKIINNKAAADTSNNSVGLNDTNGNVELSFLGEYIENHKLMLEDFESWIIEFRNTPNDAGEFTKQIKRYLHNLKGDSGTIGLTGIEKVCHYLEDFLVDHGAETILNDLIRFKEWVIECMMSYAAGERLKVDSVVFISELELNKNKSIIAEEAPPLAKSVAVESSESTDEDYKITGENDILFEFAAEAEEHLLNLENIILEKDGSYGKDDIDSIFRGVHSIKGGSAYFTLEEMTACSHILENYLSEVRDGKRQFDEVLKSLLLTYIDLQKNVLKRAREAALSDGIMKRSVASLDFLRSLEVYGKSGKLEQGSVAQVETPQTKPENQESKPSTSDPKSEAKEQSVSDTKSNEKVEVKNFVKVDTARLDLLIDSIGEMAIYSSMLIRQCKELLGNNQSVMNAAHRVEKFSRDLQDIGMSMRLVPIKGLFQKMSRLVWDTSRKLGKNIAFNMEGEDTELDRNLIDKLTDPLMHMVRNALDHGVESSEERVKAGKNAQGNIRLSAFHSGGTINICIEDDGRGLNAEKLIKKAVEKGIIPKDAKLSDEDAFQLIFAAGFSTAAAVTDISGRGVGMDVVRRNVEALRGRIMIQSEVNKGSKFTIELPLTLAIVDGIQVRVGNESFIVPNFSVVEFITGCSSLISNTLDKAETFQFRNKYLPVFRLSELYNIPSSAQRVEETAIVVVENGNEQVALMVDEIMGDYSTVIKSLGPLFDDTRGMSGCAIMPDGEVALILDARSLVELARATYRSGKNTFKTSRHDVPGTAETLH